MLRDSQKIIDVYRRYLEVTGDLVAILERHYDKLDSDKEETKNKRKEFVKHAHKIIEQMHEDVHKLFRLSWEIKDLENGE